MAKQSTDIWQQYESIKRDILDGKIAPFYLLYGKEHYFIDKICELLTSHIIPESERDFGQLVYYGADVTPAQIVSTARQYPMMVTRQLVVVKEAQMVRKIEDVGGYFDNIMPSTILVICYKIPNEQGSSKSIDKRSKFYKDAAKVGVVFESNPIPDYKMASWIEGFVKSLGVIIEPDAAAMLAESCGTDIAKVEMAIEKIKKLYAGESLSRVTSSMVAANIGINRDYSAFELTKALSMKDAVKAYKITSFFGESSKRFPIQMILAALTTHFIKLLRYHGATMQNLPKSEIASIIGVNPYFLTEYSTAAKNYPLNNCVRVISLLREYDYKSKSNMRGNATDGELLFELISKILN